MSKKTNYVYANAKSAKTVSKLFGLYHRMDKFLKNSALAAFFARLAPSKAARLKLKSTIGAQVEGSVLCGLWRKLINALLSLRLKCVGTFLFFFGFSNCLVYFGQRFFTQTRGADSSNLIFGVLLTVSSLAFFSHRTPLYESLSEGRLWGRFLKNAVFVRRSEYPKTPARDADFLCILLGVGLGALCWVVRPLVFLMTLGWIVLCALVLYKPEFGGVLTLFCLPILSERELCALSLWVFACLAFKLMRGKRVMRFELMDLIVLVFLCYFALMGLFSHAAGKGEFWLYFLLGLNYFVFKTLARRADIVRLCLSAFVTSTALVCALHILSLYLPVTWQNGALYHFGNSLPNACPSALSVAAFGLAFYFCFKGRGARAKLLSFAALFVCAAELWLFQQLAGLFAAGICVLMTVLFLSRILFFVLSAATAALFALLPLLGGPAFSHFVNLFWAGTGTSTGIANSFREILFGHGAISSKGLLHTLGITSGAHSLSLYGHLYLSIGALGLCLFFAWGIFLLMKTVHHSHLAMNRDGALLALSPMICALSLAALGTADNLLADARAFTLFFLLSALSSAACDVQSEQERVLTEQL